MPSKVLNPHTFHADADPDPGFEIFADSDPEFEIFPDLDPGFEIFADPDPGFVIFADRIRIQGLEYSRMRILILG